MNVVAIIPARGGSKRLPRKNIYPFFGKPLLQYAIEACQKSKHINKGIYVSTDDAEIASIARALGAGVIDRPAHLAADKVWTQDVLQHAVHSLEEKGVDFDTVARIYCSPYIQSEKIDEALDKLNNRNLWEIFSVDKDGVEDAVIHVLQKKCVDQKALSVYKGVIQTDYLDVHTAEDIAMAEKRRIDSIHDRSHLFLKELENTYNHASFGSELRYLLGKPRYLWRWQLKIPLWQRWQGILNASPKLKSVVYSKSGYAQAQTMRVLDLGSGFGMYWPIMREYGFRRFVGIDLFDIRGQQQYFRAAQEYISHFCSDCETQLIMGDVRNLFEHELIFPQFEVILNVATVSTKLKSTGIPKDLFLEIVEKFGTKDCIAIHLENVH